MLVSSLAVPDYNDFPFLILELTVFFPKNLYSTLLLPVSSPFVPKNYEKRDV